MENIYKEAKILIVDDEPMNVLLLEKILKKAGYSNIISTNDPREVSVIYQEHSPDIVLLDLRMPFMDGFEVMEQLKEVEKKSYLSILVLTAQYDQETRLKALNLGAKDFIAKPFDKLEVLSRINNMLEVKLLHKRILRENEILEEKVQERTKDLQETQLEILIRLGRAAGYRDNETGDHVQRMSKYCKFLAEKMGLDKNECELILNASPMHDIGKIGIPDNILLKPGKLDFKEWEIMKTHTLIGANILIGGKSDIMKASEIIARSHHEKWDGSGYPFGLAGEEIPLYGRITAICDVFDALTSERPYKKAWEIEKAIDEIKKLSGSHFDPYIANIFLKEIDGILEIKKEFSL